MQRDKEFQELMQTAMEQGRVHQEMQTLEKEVEKRDSDIQQLQKQLKEAEHILVTDMSQCTFLFSNIQLFQHHYANQNTLSQKYALHCNIVKIYIFYDFFFTIEITF